MRFLSLGRKWENNFYFCLDEKKKGRKNLYFWCGKKKEGKGRKINCILVQKRNGKDEMSFPSVARKWEGNIEIF